jgi:hypothetical protein
MKSASAMIALKSGRTENAYCVSAALSTAPCGFVDAIADSFRLLLCLVGQRARPMAV